MIKLNPNDNSGQLTLMFTAILFAAIGLGCHFYITHINSSNEALQEEYKQRLEQHSVENIYYLPNSTIDWLSMRQNTSGYFVTNPDLINEPSQYNQNSLRATRYAIATLKQLNGLEKINTKASIQFVKDNYHEFSDANGNKLAGFSTLRSNKVGVRPTMDAIISLKLLSALDEKPFNIKAIQRYILSHQNPDGGFWDPHYPKHGQVSCLKCTSFALRALGHLNDVTGDRFPSNFISDLTSYLNNSWDTDNANYSPRIGIPANDSYDIFRAFIILWHLTNEKIESKIAFTKKHLKLVDIGSTIKEKFANKGSYSRKISPNTPSMKATHLLVWMYTALKMEDELDKLGLVSYVLSNQSNPGEYGGDIYNTYSATGILKKLSIKTQPLTKPKTPTYTVSSVPEYSPYILYILAVLTGFMYFSIDKRNLASQYKKLADKASKDKLTGLYNRDFLEKAYIHHSKNGGPLALIIIDVDFFKNVNDTYGHLTGDLILQELSKILKANVRNSDVLVRWGGEEFAILCPATASEPAQLLAEKLRHIIDHHSFPEIDSLTCSFGIATTLPVETIDSAFERADKALYLAKENGRNKVIFNPEKTKV